MGGSLFALYTLKVSFLILILFFNTSFKTGIILGPCPPQGDLVSGVGSLSQKKGAQTGITIIFISIVKLRVIKMLPLSTSWDWDQPLSTSWDWDQKGVGPALLYTKRNTYGGLYNFFIQRFPVISMIGIFLFQIPPGCKDLSCQVELGVVIGKEGKDIPESEAYDHVAGYTCTLDITSWTHVKVISFVMDGHL